MSQNKKLDTDKLIYLASLSLLLSSIEYLIPKPVPFLRLGLGNLPILLALTLLNKKDYFLLALLKAICQGIVGGTLISPFFILSLAGTLASSLSMYLFHHLLKQRVTLFSISIIGALCSNTVQLLLAAVLIYGKSIFIAASLLLGIGVVASAILGLLAEALKEKSRFYATIEQGNLPAIETHKESKETHKITTKQKIFTVISFAGIITSFLLSDLIALTIGFIILLILQKLSGRKVLIGFYLAMILSMVFLCLFEPEGQVIYVIGIVKLTKGALILSLTRGMRILMIMASSQILSATRIIHLPLLGSVFSLSAKTINSFSQTKGNLLTRLDFAILGEIEEEK